MQVIAFLHSVFKTLGKHIRTALVVCPKNTLVNWYAEFTKWLEGNGIRGKWKVRKLDDVAGIDDRSRIGLLEKWTRKGGVLLITPDMFKRLASKPGASTGGSSSTSGKNDFPSLLLDPGPDLLIVDEGHIYLTTSSSSNNQQTQVLSMLCKVTRYPDSFTRSKPSSGSLTSF